jgi:4-hydroxy-3-methylbut-2-enyl diphosphate reductase
MAQTNKESKLLVEIDNRSGFCFGVVNAVAQAETELANNEPLYCLGEIVHNSEEVERLKGKGLITISHNDLDSLKGKTVLLRAHGEPPQTYEKAIANDVKLVDASCPVVLKLQVKVREAWARMQNLDGQIVIFGKKGHAEVSGLVGQTDGNAIVIEDLNDVARLNFSKPIEIFAQTTISSDKFIAIVDSIKERMQEANASNDYHYKVHNSICGQVANRKSELANFATRFDTIIFVSGKNSSNGKMLFEVCKAVNPKTYFISSEKEIIPLWFENVKSVGICGATSTPLWLMEKVADRINSL